jgi:hypothetical protein
MTLLIDLVVFLVGLGFMEYIVKPFSIFLARKSLSLLPKLFDYLDPFMPEAIAKWTPEEMSTFIYGSIDKLTKTEGVSLTSPEKDKLFNEFVHQYNVLVAASKVNPDCGTK